MTTPFGYDPTRWAKAIEIATEWARAPEEVYAILKESNDDDWCARSALELAARLNADAGVIVRGLHLMRNAGITGAQFVEAIRRLPPPDAVERAMLATRIAEIERRRRPWWRKVVDPFQ
jgi:hypothetical protein